MPEIFNRESFSFVMPERFYQASTSFVIPEIFNQASMFLLFLWVLNTSGPRLKDCRGDEQGAINTFRGRLKAARKSPG